MQAALKRLLDFDLVWNAAAFLRAPGCVVLTYHRVGANALGFKTVPRDSFRQQMQWVRQRCNVIGPSELVAHSRRAGHDRPSVLVTFDDGYADFAEDAYPILKEFEIPAANFLSTNHIDSGELFWWELVDLAIQRTRLVAVQLPWETSPQRLDQAGRHAVGISTRRQIKTRAHHECAAILDSLFAALGLTRDDLHAPRQVMTWDQVRATSDLITYGGHTHTHPLLTRVDDQQVDWEIRTCRDRITSETGITPRLFAYPSGAFSTTTKAAVAVNGFEVGFTTLEGLNAPGTDWLEVRRLHGPRLPGALPYLVSGIWAR